MPPKRKRVVPDFGPPPSYKMPPRPKKLSYGRSMSAWEADYGPDEDEDYEYSFVPPPAKKRATASSQAGSSPAASGSGGKEKRLARIRNSCPMNIAERVERVMTQRFFMIERAREGDELRETFSVLGSTGNVYTVTIDRLPSCTCPDAAKGNHCKHILFVMLKVLNVNQNSMYYYQKALLTSELQEIFDNAPQNPSSVASQRVRDLYAEATGTSPTKGKKKAEPVERKKLEEGDDCPVCYEGMHEDHESKLTWCETCKNAIHKECFGQWRRTEVAKGGEVHCVWCRAVWADDLPGGAGGKGKAVMSRDGYLNLASVAGVSRVRDTSTYYDGPRRGYGYSYY